MIQSKVLALPQLHCPERSRRCRCAACMARTALYGITGLLHLSRGKPHPTQAAAMLVRIGMPKEAMDLLDAGFETLECRDGDKVGGIDDCRCFGCTLYRMWLDIRSAMLY